MATSQVVRKKTGVRAEKMPSTRATGTPDSALQLEAPMASDLLAAIGPLGGEMEAHLSSRASG